MTTVTTSRKSLSKPLLRSSDSAPTGAMFFELCKMHMDTLTQLLSHWSSITERIVVVSLRTFALRGDESVIPIYEGCMKNLDKCKLVADEFIAERKTLNANAGIAIYLWLKLFTVNSISKTISMSNSQTRRYISHGLEILQGQKFVNKLCSIAQHKNISIHRNAGKQDISELLNFTCRPFTDDSLTSKVFQDCNITLENISPSNKHTIAGLLFQFVSPSVAVGARMIYEGISDDIIYRIKLKNNLCKSTTDESTPNFKVNRRSFYTYIRKHQEEILTKLKSEHSELFKQHKDECPWIKLFG